MFRWIIDPDHSVGSFSIRHMMIACVHGQMNKVSGTVEFDPSDMTSLSVELKIDVSSIITGIRKRDEHLKSADFFDMEKYPVIMYKSNGTEPTGYSSCKVSGSATIHGITHPVTMDVIISGPVMSPFGETSIGISGSTVIDREDFGMKWNEPMENHGVMVGKDVRISMDIEADRMQE